MQMKHTASMQQLLKLANISRLFHRMCLHWTAIKIGVIPSLWRADASQGGRLDRNCFLLLLTFIEQQDERLSGITTPSGGLQPFPSARIKIAGGHQRDRHSKSPTSRWEPWEVSPPS